MSKTYRTISTEVKNARREARYSRNAKPKPYSRKGKNKRVDIYG